MDDDGGAPARIKVVIVDDHELVRSGIEMTLGLYDDLELVGQAAGGRAAIAVCEKTRPDVILMDLVMPGMDGVEATVEILRRVPQTRILALTSFSDAALIERALQAGAAGYILKNVSAPDLARAIRQTCAGAPALAPEVAEVLMHAMTAPPPPGAALTEREREVIALVAKGLTNAEIADQLVVSLSTVKTHMSSILGKLGASGRTELVAIAMREHLL